MQNPPAAILFDLDGTLADTLPDLRTALNLVLADLGRRQVSLDEVRGWIGDGVGVLVRRGMAATGGPPAESPETTLARFRACYADHLLDDSRLYPGVAATLRQLRDAGHLLGVCTNKPQAHAERLIASLGIGALFAAIVGGDRVPAHKPDPGHLRAALAAMGAERHRALMVGDGPNDVKAARAADLPVVLVGYGYAHGDPRALGADLVIDEFAELPAAAAPYL